MLAACASERFSTIFFASDTFFAVWVGYRGEDLETFVAGVLDGNGGVR